MKIGCHCGAVIVDQTDDLPHKGHLIPDQDFYAVFDALDNRVIDPVADGRLGRKEAYRVTRLIISGPSRLVWQCVACGRLYLDAPDGQLRCFVPEGELPDRNVLGRGPRPA